MQRTSKRNGAELGLDSASITHMTDPYSQKNIHRLFTSVNMGFRIRPFINYWWDFQKCSVPIDVNRSIMVNFSGSRSNPMISTSENPTPRVLILTHAEQYIKVLSV